MRSAFQRMVARSSAMRAFSRQSKSTARSTARTVARPGNGGATASPTISASRPSSPNLSRTSASSSIAPSRSANSSARVSGLGGKLSVLLVQLPPKLAFEAAFAGSFFAELKARTPAAIACEPRHPGWFGPAADDLFQRLGIARVAADPAVCAAAGRPGGSPSPSYWRLHGSPVTYRSSYRDRIASYAALLKSEAEAGRMVWCIFDNTASSAAAGDALALMSELAKT